MNPKETMIMADYLAVKEELNRYKRALSSLKEDAENRSDWWGQDGSDARVTISVLEEVERMVASPTKDLPSEKPIEYQHGNLVEVGMGEVEENSGEVENGKSAFFYVDRPVISEDDLVDLFSGQQPVLYICKAETEQGKDWARENSLALMI